VTAAATVRVSTSSVLRLIYCCSGQHGGSGAAGACLRWSKINVTLDDVACVRTTGISLWTLALCLGFLMLINSQFFPLIFC